MFDTKGYVWRRYGIRSRSRVTSSRYAWSNTIRQTLCNLWKCTRDVYAKQDSELAKYQFTRFTCQTVNVYSCGAYDDILELDPLATTLTLVNHNIYPLALLNLATFYTIDPHESVSYLLARYQYQEGDFGGLNLYLSNIHKLPPKYLQC